MKNKMLLMRLFESFSKDNYNPSAFRQAMRINEKTDVRVFQRFLKNKNKDVVNGTLYLLSRFGDLSIVGNYLECRVKTKGLDSVFENCMKVISKRYNDSIDIEGANSTMGSIEFLSTFENDYIRNRVIDVLMKTGQKDFLISAMITCEDELLIEKIRRYMNEQ